MKRLQIISVVLMFLGAALAPQSFADKGAADELMAALKACKADAAATKSAKAMIDKHGGTPSDDDVDNWVDEQDDALFDCLDKEL